MIFYINLTYGIHVTLAKLERWPMAHTSICHKVE